MKLRGFFKGNYFHTRNHFKLQWITFSQLTHKTLRVLLSADGSVTVEPLFKLAPCSEIYTVKNTTESILLSYSAPIWESKVELAFITLRSDHQEPLRFIWTERLKSWKWNSNLNGGVLNKMMQWEQKPNWCLMETVGWWTFKIRSKAELCCASVPADDLQTDSLADGWSKIGHHGNDDIIPATTTPTEPPRRAPQNKEQEEEGGGGTVWRKIGPKKRLRSSEEHSSVFDSQLKLCS